MAKHYDVAIVGLGPVGATLANLLGKSGLSVVVFEREKEIHQLPRAVHFDDEVLRVFQAIGLAEEVEKNSPFNPGMRFVDTNGKLLLDWPRPPEVGEHLWHTSFHFHQPDLEKVLRSGLARYSLVKVISPASVVRLHQHNTCVEVAFNRTEAAGVAEAESIQASFVVGCDGARSTVRQQMASSVEDLGFRERWLVVDVLLHKDKPELGDYTIQYCNPDRPSTYVRGPGSRRRWEITVKEHEDETEITTTDSVWQLLQRWLDPLDAEIERRAVYTFHSMIARQWRSDRLFLAGDAAHQMPPFMGQGMCAGIRDVANLAWKLQACINNNADDTLLESYQSERYPHVAAYINTAIKLGGLINACETEDALRLAFRPKDGSAKMKSIEPVLGSGIVDTSNAEFDTAHTGWLAPQPRLADQSKLDDRIGCDSVFLVSDEIHRQLSIKQCGLKMLSAASEPEIKALLQRFDCIAILIRPDRYIVGTAKNKLQAVALMNFANDTGLLMQHNDAIG